MICPCCKRARNKQSPVSLADGKGSYHSATYKVLIAILVQQVTGQSVDTIFRKRVTEPLRIAVYPNVRQSELANASPTHVSPGHTTFQSIRDPRTKLGRAWRPFIKPGAPYPSAIGKQTGLSMASARGLAKFAAALANRGEIGGVRILSEQQTNKLDRRTTMGKEEWTK